MRMVFNRPVFFRVVGCDSLRKIEDDIDLMVQLKERFGIP